MPSELTTDEYLLSLSEKAIRQVFFENTLSSCVIFRPDRTIVAFNNHAFQRIKIQLNKELSIGACIDDFIPTGMELESLSDIQEVLKGKEINKVTFVEHLTQPNWIKYNYTPIFNDTGSDVAFICLNIYIYEKSPADGNENEYSLLLYRKLFEFSADASIIIEVGPRRSTHFLECNARGLELLGFRTQQELAQHWDRFHLTPYDDARVDRLFETIEREGRYADEFQLIPFRGQPIFVSFRIYQFTFHGKTYHIIKLSDINRLKEHEQKLRQQDELFSFITKATQDGLYNYDLLNNRIWVSDEYLKMIGNVEEAQDHHIEWFIQRVHPEDRNDVEEHLRSLLEGDVTNMNLEYRFKHVNGQYLYFIDRGFILRDAQNRVSQIIGAMTDVTQLRLNEKLIAESEKQLLNILNTVKETVFSFTYISKEKPRFNFISKGDLKNWGYSEDDLIGPKQFWYHKVLDEDKIKIVNPALKRLKKIESVEIEYRFEKPEGEIIWINSRLSPQRISDTETLIIGTAIDITEKKRVDQMLIQQNEELKKTNMELDRFVYSTSHDLRAPLTSVMGLVNLFSMETDHPEHQKYLHMIRTSITRLDHFITNIVDYSRNSRTGVAYEQVDLKAMLRESFDQLQFMEGSEKVVEHFDISEDLILVTDKTRLQMILNNLISNAIKYRKKDLSSCVIVVTAHPNDSHSGVTIRISDNGIGIPENNLNHIFDMFFTGSSENHGSGIGLYIVKESVEKLRGKISVTSALMQGSTFNIELPSLIY